MYQVIYSVSVGVMPTLPTGRQKQNFYGLLSVKSVAVPTLKKVQTECSFNTRFVAGIIIFAYRHKPPRPTAFHIKSFIKRPKAYFQFQISLDQVVNGVMPTATPHM